MEQESKNIDYEKVVASYILLRDKIDEAKRKFDEAIKPKKELLERIETLLCGDLEQKGLQSMSVTAGTVYKEKWKKVVVEDWDAFINYVSENKRYDMFERRVAKNVTLDTIDQEGSVPGIEVQSGFNVRIRRK